MDRTVTGHIPLSLDGRVSGPGGEHDMGWTVRHALTGAARAQLLEVTGTATTVLLDGPDQGFGGLWPAVAGDEDADPRDRLFAQWLNESEKILVSRTLTEPRWPDYRVVDDDPAEIVRRLRKEDGGDIVVLASQASSAPARSRRAGPAQHHVVPGAHRGRRPPVRRRPGGLVLVADRGHADQQRRALPVL